MEYLVRKLRALAGAASLSAFHEGCGGLGPMLASYCPAGAPPGRGVTRASAREAAVAAAAEAPQLVPALAGALATGLRMVFPRGADSGWDPATQSGKASAALGLLAEFFMNTSGGINGGFPAWPANVLALLRRTELVPLLGGACAALARAPAASGPSARREQYGLVYALLCSQLAPACLHLSIYAAVNGREEEAAAACLQVADLSAHLLRRRFGGGDGGGGGGRGSAGRSSAGSSAERAPQPVEFLASRVREGTPAGADGFADRATLIIAEATTGQVCILINQIRCRNTPHARRSIDVQPERSPFARAILLDPQRRFLRLATAWLAYSLQGDAAAVVDAGRRVDAVRRVGPRLAQLFEAIELPAATQAALARCGFQLEAVKALEQLQSYLDSHDWCCEGAGLPAPLLALPPAACAPMARALTDLLAVCRVGSEAERGLVFAHAHVVLQMTANSDAVEAVSPGWAAGSAGALFEACVAKGCPGGKPWELQEQASSLYVVLAKDHKV